MDTIIAKIAELPFVKVLLELAGVDKTLIPILSIVIVLFIITIISSLRKKIFQGLYEWHKIIKKAKDLKPEFEENDIKELSRIFIKTTGAEKSPNRYDNPEEVYKYTGKTYDLIDFMLQSFSENTENHKFYLVLADSGMGKTAFMVNLYLKNYSYRKLLFGNRYTIKLLRFQSNNTEKPVDILERIKSMKCDDIPNTILLLDGLDEDPFIYSKDKSVSDEKAFNDRVAHIAGETCNYKEVVITCRTQYFPQQEDDVYELNIKKTNGKGFHSFQKYYIFPFSDLDVTKYLNKKYGWWIFKYLHGEKKDIALRVVKNSKNLMLRPMLMSYIEYLVDDKKVYNSSVEIYDALIEKWLTREGEKWKKETERKNFINALKQFSGDVAVEIYNSWMENGTLYISREKAEEIAGKCHYPVARHEATGKSLLTCDANRNFKFSHKSILEFCLAKEALKLNDFTWNLDLSGMDMARLFCFEFGISSYVQSNYAPITGGEFLMGSPVEEVGHSDSEKQYSVIIPDFYLCKYTVCLGDFKRFIDDTNYRTDAEKANSSYILDGKSWKEKEGIHWRHDVSGNERPAGEYNHPVLHVSWNDALAYCEWLSKKSDKIFRLPTEAEWEYACRAGTTTPFNTGKNLTNDQANYNGNFPYDNNPKGFNRKNTVSVDSFAPNGWGLYNMHGNVWEWTDSWYDEPDLYRVLRGGSWCYDAGYCRSAYRRGDTPDCRYNYVGFRLVFVP